MDFITHLKKGFNKSIFSYQIEFLQFQHITCAWIEHPKIREAHCQVVQKIN